MSTPSKKELEKPREEWFFQRTAFPLRDAAPVELEKFWENQHKYLRAANIEWQEAGPANYAGRVTCLSVDPRDSRRIVAGSGGGGLWSTGDRGETWKSIWPKFLNQNIGAVVWNPLEPGVLLCATGEGNLSSGTYPGSGIYISRDEGFTWQSFLTAPGGRALSGKVRINTPRRITAIALGPPMDGMQPIAFGSSTRSEELNAGIFINEGAAGLRYVDYWGNRSYNCYSLFFHPNDGNVLYAAIQTGGATNGVWRSADMGKSWTQFDRANGLPPGEACGRIALAISPSDPQVLYAMIAGHRSGIIGVFRTSDGGKHWVRTRSEELRKERTMSYNSTIAIHPKDPDFVLCGGTNLHVTRNGGANWTRATTGERDTPDGKVPANFVHNDHHAIAILPGGWIYAGHDGGVSISQDSGVTWTEKSNGMVTTMFYDIDVSPADSRIFGGGAQDAGSLIAGVTPDGGISSGDPRQFTRVLPGDGGWLLFDPVHPLKVFGATADATRIPFVYRHLPGEIFAKGDRLAPWPGIATLKLSPAEQRLRSLTLLAIQPAHRNRKQRLWLATHRLWRTEDDGITWLIGSHNFDGSAVSALEFASADPSLAFAGTSSGGIFRSRNGGLTWSADLAGPEIPRRLVTQIEVHPNDANIVIATVAATDISAVALDGDDRPFGHVFRSMDGGDTWSDIDLGRLPNVIYNGLAFETHPPYRLFLAGDTGVWVFQDEQFVNLSGDLPNVVVSDLNYHGQGRILTAGTYGRGIWRLPVPEGRTFEIETFLPGLGWMDPPFPAAGLIRDLAVAPPKLRAPRHRSEIDRFPRKTRLSWRPVPHAEGYIVEVEFNGSFLFRYTSRTASLSFEGNSSGEAVWRVWAILPGSRRTMPSDAWSIHYLQ